MTDRELIDLAAKAADIQLVDLLDSYGDLGGLEREGWNPLKNDGEALRLAVKLNFSVEVCDEKTTVFYVELNQLRKVTCCNAFDKENATRRAIVMAAAEIGRNMK